MTTEELLHAEQQHVWHPFTQMAEWEPLFIERAEGVFLFDTEGRRYYDANSSLWVNVHGHCRPEIDAAVRAQLDRIAHSTMLGLTHPLAAELAARLAAIAPAGLTRVFYSDSGSEAVEIALKIAFQYWRHRGETGRTRYVALRDSYHGDTIGAVSVGGIDLFHSIFRPLLFQAEFAPSPGSARDEKEAGAGLEAVLDRFAGQIAAVVVEPLIQAAGGFRLAPPGTLRRFRVLCDRYDVLLVVDEVATGFGRTGRMFACEHEGVAPDLMCVAKGLTGGYLPLAATLAREEVYAAFLGDFSERKTLYHGHSYTGNPLACAAAMANLDIFSVDRVIEGLPPKVAAAQRALDRLRDLPHVGEIRQRGLMVGIELVEDRTAVQPYPWQQAMGARVCRRARELGLITRPLGDVVIFLPPLASTEEQIEEMVGIIGRAIELETGRRR